MDSVDEYRWMFADEYPAVVRTVYLVLHDYARSEEIAQDAFLQLLRHWNKVRRYDAPGAWVRRVAIRLATRDAKREQRRIVLTRETIVQDRVEPSPAATLDPELTAAIKSLHRPAASCGGALLLRGSADGRDRRDRRLLGIHRLGPSASRPQATWHFSDRIREGIGFEATYKVIDHSTVVVTEPGGDETVFAYAVEGDAIRISFKNADPQQMCQGDPKCPMGFIVWESAPFSRV